MKEEIIVCKLGQVAYEPAWELQKLVQAELIKAKREAPPRLLPHIMLLVEHPPVFTLGKSGDAQHLLVSEAMLKQRGASFFHIDRGGDITFHGPGQLVGYPILDLDRFSPDIHLYLRNLEEAIINTCTAFGIETGRIEGKTGVWLEASPEKQERKICAMGIRCSRWVTMHGFALNMNTDLSFFSYIVPCGIVNKEVTSLAKELGYDVDQDLVIDTFMEAFSGVFDAKTTVLSKEASIDFLSDFLPESMPAQISDVARFVGN